MFTILQRISMRYTINISKKNPLINIAIIFQDQGRFSAAHILNANRDKNNYQKTEYLNSNTEKNRKSKKIQIQTNKIF